MLSELRMRIPILLNRWSPAWALRLARGAVTALTRVAFFGWSVSCPICEKSFRRFANYNGRTAVMCPKCRTLERHRLLWSLLEHRAVMTSEPRILHFAAEPGIEAKLRTYRNLDYVTADLFDTTASLRLDVTDIDLDDDSFDIVICSHVLEHVDDSNAAMRELARVTRPDGWAVLDTPVFPELEGTFEDWSVVTPRDRQRLFGQFDHVRKFGSDFPAVLHANGWDPFLWDGIQEIPLEPGTPLTSAEGILFGLPSKGEGTNS